eukprot:802286-Pelagomonas_calceolata.AAC.1
MQSHAQKLHKAVESGKYTFVFPQEAQKFENSIALKNGKMVQEAMINVFMLCFALQFSASTVIDALQCFKK